MSAPPVGHGQPVRSLARQLRSNHLAIGYLIFLPATVLFGLNATVSKQLLLGGVPSDRLAQLRVTFAFLVLLVYVLIRTPRQLRLHRRELPTVLLYGLVGLALTQWLYFVAIERLPVGLALLIEFTAPIMVALWVRFAWKQPVRDRVWAALVLAVIGLGLVGRIWDGFALDGVGVAAAFGAAAALATYYLSGERGLSTREPVSLTMWGLGAAAVLWAVAKPWWSFPWDAVTDVSGQIGPLSGIPGWWLAAYMILLGTVVPFALELIALRYLTAARASAVGMAEPLLAAAIAWIVLGEALTPVQVIGGAVVLTGVLIAENSR